MKDPCLLSVQEMLSRTTVLKTSTLEVRADSWLWQRSAAKICSGTDSRCYPAWVLLLVDYRCLL